jgi:hypothetical protein
MMMKVYSSLLPLPILVLCYVPDMSQSKYSMFPQIVDSLIKGRNGTQTYEEMTSIRMQQRNPLIHLCKLSLAMTFEWNFEG